MTVDVLTNITINVPREQAADYVANPENAPQWYANIKSAEWKTEKSLSIGSKIAFKAEFLGRVLEYVYEIIEYIPGHKLVMKTADGPFPMETTYTWEETNVNSTYMTLRNKGIPKGFSKIFTPFMSLLMEKANKKDLKLIKEILEQ
jgi:hypothetical protein